MIQAYTFGSSFASCPKADVAKDCVEPFSEFLKVRF